MQGANRSTGAERSCRIMICDDQPAFREVLRAVLELEDGLEVVGEAANGAEAIEGVRHLQPDVLLLDVAMPVMDGIEALPEVVQAAPDTVVVVLTGVTSAQVRQRALDAGASVVLEKGTDLDAMTRCVREVCEG